MSKLSKDIIDLLAKSPAKKRKTMMSNPEDIAKQFVEEERLKEKSEVKRDLLQMDYKASFSAREVENRLVAIEKILESHKEMLTNCMVYLPDGVGAKALVNHSDRLKKIEEQLVQNTKSYQVHTAEWLMFQRSYFKNMEDIEFAVKSSWSYRIRSFFGV